MALPQEDLLLSLPPKDVLHFLQSKVKKIKTIHEAFGDYWHARGALEAEYAQKQQQLRQHYSSQNAWRSTWQAMLQQMETAGDAHQTWGGDITQHLAIPFRDFLQADVTWLDMRNVLFYVDVSPQHETHQEPKQESVLTKLVKEYDEKANKYTKACKKANVSVDEADKKSSKQDLSLKKREEALQDFEQVRSAWQAKAAEALQHFQQIETKRHHLLKASGMLMGTQLAQQAAAYHQQSETLHTAMGTCVSPEEDALLWRQELLSTGPKHDSATSLYHGRQPPVVKEAPVAPLVDEEGFSIRPPDKGEAATAEEEEDAEVSRERATSAVTQPPKLLVRINDAPEEATAPIAPPTDALQAAAESLKLAGSTALKVGTVRGRRQPRPHAAQDLFSPPKSPHASSQESVDKHPPFAHSGILLPPPSGPPPEDDAISHTGDKEPALPATESKPPTSALKSTSLQHLPSQTSIASPPEVVVQEEGVASVSGEESDREETNDASQREQLVETKESEAIKELLPERQEEQRADPWHTVVMTQSELCRFTGQVLTALGTFTLTPSHPHQAEGEEPDRPVSLQVASDKVTLFETDRPVLHRPVPQQLIIGVPFAMVAKTTSAIHYRALLAAEEAASPATLTSAWSFKGEQRTLLLRIVVNNNPHFAAKAMPMELFVVVKVAWKRQKAVLQQCFPLRLDGTKPASTTASAEEVRWRLDASDLITMAEPMKLFAKWTFTSSSSSSSSEEPLASDLLQEAYIQWKPQRPLVTWESETMQQHITASHDALLV